MKVTFRSPQKLGNKSYSNGTQDIPGHLHGNLKFKQLVQEGTIIVHERDANAQAVQESKDAHNARKSELARQLTKKLDEERAAHSSPTKTAAAVKKGKK